MSNIVKPTSARASSSWAKYWPNRLRRAASTWGWSIIDPIRSKRSSTSATDAGPLPGQLEVDVVEGSTISIEGVGRQAVERLLEWRLGRRLGIARHGGADDRRWPARRQRRELRATRRANVAALRWRRAGRGHDGGRFSAKAAMPSAASALWKWWSERARIRANASSRRDRSSSPAASRASASSPRRPAAPRAAIAAQRWSTTAVTSSVTWVTRPTWRAYSASNGSPVRNAAARLRRRDPAEDRHRDDRRDDTDADLGEGERHGAVHDDEVARRHQADAAGPRRPGDGGDRRHVGVHQPLERAHDRSRVRRPARPLLEVGAGAERRRRVGEHDRADVAGGDRLPRRRRGRRAGRRRAGATGRCGWRASRA